MYNRDYRSTRFSPLSEITPRNVPALRPICSYAIPENSQFESGLVAVNGILYFTTFEHTYAIDAETCALKWSVANPQVWRGGNVRGLAFARNRVFRGFYDGSVIAYDADSGEQVWASKLEAPHGEFAVIAASPIAWNGMVFIGTSLAEYGHACVVVGLDASTGRVVWTFPLVPAGNAPGAETWPKGVHVAGGSTWSSFTLDPDSGALYVPTGNPGPVFSGAYRPGANLYTGSVVVLDAKTGKLRTWYQLVPHDIHDFDVAATPALITTRSGARRAMTGGKDGYLHAIDIDAGKVAWKTAVTTIDNVDAPLTPQGTHFCPGTGGGVEWNGPAYSAITNLVYVNSVDWCSTLKLDPKLPAFEEGKAFLGSLDEYGVHDSKKVGWVTAVDADTGAVRWRYASPAPMLAGLVATAGGLLFTVDLDGNFLVFDAATGTVLHKIATRQTTGGGVITYQSGGKQRIAVAAGLDDVSFQVHGKPVVVVYGL